MAKAESISLINLQYFEKYKSVNPLDISKLVTSIEDQVNKEMAGGKSISVIFVDSGYIRELNNEFRKIDQSTDVLSFNIDDGVNEVYISPSYIFKSYKGGKFITEIIRMIIHGILHIYGYDHKNKFHEESNDLEEMFVIQERILNNVLNRN